MFAIAYLVAMVAIGDRAAQRFFPMTSLVHRASAAVLVGLLLATWVTYLAAALVAGVEEPLLVGNIAFLALAAYAVRDAPRRASSFVRGMDRRRLRRGMRRNWLELALLGLLAFVSGWLAWHTFSVKDGELLIGNIVYSDFGSTTAISQSFAQGNNFPTVYPHFAGEPIRYHFLFYFQAGNLSFLGLNPSLALNLLSVATLTAMLGVVITFGRELFGSLIVGWLGAALFYFHGSLSWLPYFASRPSIDAALAEIPTRREFLVSGFPYRGEEWGVWSLAVFANQRHFASGIGILLLVLLFLAMRWRRRTVPAAREGGSSLSRLRELRWREVGHRIGPAVSTLDRGTVASFAFAGLLLGALPMWNGAVFVAAFVVLAVLFVVMPDRRYMVFLGLAAGLAALPQLDFLRPSAGVNAAYPSFHWGYIVDDPTPLNVLAYFAFTFGPKLLIAVVALFFLRRVHRALFLAASALVVLAVTAQFSAEVLVNHKFLNIWLIIVNLFVAYTVWRIWRAPPVGRLNLGRLAAAAMVVVIGIGGAIDLMPFRNGNWIGVPYRDDPLADWLTERTDGRDVFLTDIVVTHPILAGGRVVFLGWTYYAWSAGYDMPAREATYRQMYTESDPEVLAQLLRSHDIAYVVFDNGLRDRGFVEDPNEQVYRENFPVAFEHADYGDIRIYAVP